MYINQSSLKTCKEDFKINLATCSSQSYIFNILKLSYNDLDN